MAVTATQLREPQGRLPDAVFPDGSTSAAIDAILDAYIADGAARATAASVDAADVDAYVTAWAYHRAYHARWVQLSTTPASLSEEGQGSSAYLLQQIQNFKALADAALADADALLPTPAPDAAPVRVSRTVEHDFTW